MTSRFEEVNGTGSHGGYEAQPPLANTWAQSRHTTLNKDKAEFGLRDASYDPEPDQAIVESVGRKLQADVAPNATQSLESVTATTADTTNTQAAGTSDEQNIAPTTLPDTQDGVFVEATNNDHEGQECSTQAVPEIITNNSSTDNALSKDNAELEYPQIELNLEPQPGDASHAHDLSTPQWNEVMRTNSLLFGFYIREANEDIVRARHNAFILKGSSSAKLVAPCFQVEDGSSIQVQETKNAFQRSLAHNSFSKQCIQSNLSVGDFGIMAGLSGSQAKEKKKDEKYHQAIRDQEYYAVYNFPRARLFLDEEQLELSKMCKEMLIDLRSNPFYDRLERFYKLFGHVYVTSVVLGGQQKTSKFAAALSKLNEDVQQDALRSAIGAKVNAQYISVSAEASREKSRATAHGDQQYASLSSLGISSSGGDTLIGSDISKWVRTVAPCKNWRVIENEIAESIHELIGKFPGWEDIPTLFRKITQARPSKYRPWTGKISFTMRGRPLCWDTENGPLRLHCPKDLANASNKAIFEVVSAVKQASEEALLPLTSDWPYFLRAGPGLGLSSGHWRPLGVEPDIYGAAFLTTEFDQSISHCRFSLRAINRSGIWRPDHFNQDGILTNGEQVQLYCHSLGLGPYLSLNRPPSLASPANYYSEPDGGYNIYFKVHPEHRAPSNRDLIKSYDGNRLSAPAREAIEKMGFISTREYAPGPHVEKIAKQQAFSLKPNISIPNISIPFVDPSIGIYRESSESEIEYSMINGQRVRLSMDKLQQAKYKSQDLDWSLCQRRYAEDAGGGVATNAFLCVVYE